MKQLRRCKRIIASLGRVNAFSVEWGHPSLPMKLIYNLTHIQSSMVQVQIAVCCNLIYANQRNGVFSRHINEVHILKNYLRKWLFKIFLIMMKASRHLPFILYWWHAVASEERSSYSFIIKTNKKFIYLILFTFL